MLKLRAGTCQKALLEALGRMADELIEEYEAEIRQGMKSPSGAGDLERGLSYEEKNVLHREVVGGAWAIMDSFGTGSKMDRDNPALEGYQGSAMWNQLRQGYEIIGRPPGEYVNIFGETAVSSGVMAGRNIESVVHPRSPSKAFQQAIQWMQAGNRINKRFAECINQFDFSPFFVWE